MDNRLSSTAMSHTGDRSYRMKNLLLVSSLPACLCLITVMGTVSRQKTPLPQFNIQVDADTPVARTTSSMVKTYRIIRIIPGAWHCIVIADDGSHFTVVGTTLSKVKPGLVFQARITPVVSWSTMHQKHRTLWLVEPPP